MSGRQRSAAETFPRDQQQTRPIRRPDKADHDQRTATTCAGIRPERYALRSDVRLVQALSLHLP
jgi:hypothetical protein